jgi:Cu-Zn family superoxide dismutase
MRAVPIALMLAAALGAAPALADSVRTDLALATPTGPGAVIGTAVISDGPSGAVIALDLHGLPAGPHGLHLHQNGSCQPATAADGTITPAGAAGGHLDPAMTGHHMGPLGAGHLGDLPLVEVGADGVAKTTLTAPHVTSVSALKGRTLMLHAGGDNYTDTPPLGGGGKRLACGVLQ